MKKTLIFNLLSIFTVLLVLASCSVSQDGQIEKAASPQLEGAQHMDAQEALDAPENAVALKVDLDSKSVDGISKGIWASHNDYVKVTEPTPGKYVVTVNLRPAGKTHYKKALFSVYNSAATSGYCVNIGDSRTNNGYSGDGATQQNDAEIQVVDNVFKAYLSDRQGGDATTKECGSFSNFLPTSGFMRVRYEISDQKVVFWKGRDGSPKTTLSHPYLFALNGQSDSEGPVNYTIYAGFNRSIGSSYRTGEGIIGTVYIYLQDAL